MKIHVDATPKAVAIKVKQTGFDLNIPTETTDIVCNELTAILVGLKYGNQFPDKKIVILTDSTAAFRIVCNGHASNPLLNSVVKEINYELNDRPVKALEVRMYWLSGKLNKADKVSRKTISSDWHNNKFLYL